MTPESNTPRASSTETHSDAYCLHPYFGFVCTPGARIDFSDSVPAHFGHGAVALIDRHGFRNRGVPDQKPAGEFWVGLFGGSTAFSSCASDEAATIAGQLEARLQGRVAAGRRVRVLNLALPACQQPQQLIICLLHLDKLDGIITFDGVNEVVIPGSYNAGTIPLAFPYLPIYRTLYGSGISEAQIILSWQRRELHEKFEQAPWALRALRRATHDAALADLTEQLRDADRGGRFSSMFPSLVDGPNQAIVEGAATWQACVERMHQVCGAAGVKTLFAVQPIPDVRKPMTAREASSLERYADVVALRRQGYELILQHARALSARGITVAPLTDVFEGHAEDIYTDLVHFEDRGSGIVADRLAALIGDAWKG